jgi:hypothetical protein
MGFFIEAIADLGKRDFPRIAHMIFSIEVYKYIVHILFNERIMMGITREDDFVSRAAGDYEEKLINKFHYWTN